MVHAEWITHLVRKGNIVVYPKYQDDLDTPTDSFMYYAAEAIKISIDEMQGVGYVKPRLNNFAMIGHSYGGAISANLTYLYASYGLPQVKALMVAQGYYGTDMLLPSYQNFPYNTKIQLVVGADDTTVDSTFARLLMDSAIVDPLYKNYIVHHADNHGSPSVSATHTDPVCLSPNNDYDSGESNFWVFGAQFFNRVDVVDYYCYWKLSEALLNCTFYDQNCEYAFGDTPEQRFMGLWSDSTGVRELQIEPRSLTPVHNTESKTIELSLWPNPTSNNVIIKTQKVLDKATLQVFSATGVLISSQKLIDSENGAEIQLPDVKGLYFLVIRQGNSFVSKKIIRTE